MYQIILFEHWILKLNYFQKYGYMIIIENVLTTLTKGSPDQPPLWLRLLIHTQLKSPLSNLCSFHAICTQCVMSIISYTDLVTLQRD